MTSTGRSAEAVAAVRFKAWQPAAALQGLDWSGFELHERVAPDETQAVGVACWGIAETGAQDFHSDAETAILAYVDDYAPATTGWRPPRNVNIITGASDTADIEDSLVLGARATCRGDRRSARQQRRGVRVAPSQLCAGAPSRRLHASFAALSSGR